MCFTIINAIFAQIYCLKTRGQFDQSLKALLQSTYGQLHCIKRKRHLKNANNSTFQSCDQLLHGMLYVVVKKQHMSTGKEVGHKM